MQQIWQFPAISLGDLIEFSLSIFTIYCIKRTVYILVWAGILRNLSRGEMQHMGDLGIQRTILNHVPEKNGLLEQKALSVFPGEYLVGCECKFPMLG